MRLVTWNVNSLAVRLPRVLELLSEHRPDVVCMQETKCAPEAFPHEALALAGYHAADHSGGRWAGVAILARAELALADISRGLPGEPDAQDARWVEATVAGVRVVSTYVPNGRSLDDPMYAVKLAFLASAAERVAALRGEPLVVCGDFNVCPTDADVYDPAAFVGATHVSAPERQALAALLEAGELHDAYRRLHPDTQQFTWWDYRQGHFHRGMGLRIDLVLTSGDLAERLGACGIARDYRKGPKPSDHAPVLVDWD